DWGSIQVIEPAHKVQSLALPVQPLETAGVLVETSGLVNAQNNQRIAPERMTVILNNQPAPLIKAHLTMTPVILNLGETPTNGPIDAKFDLELRPGDGPGSYEGVVQFRFWAPDSQQPDGKVWSEPVKITMKVKLEAWIRLKTTTTSIRLEPDPLPNNQNLKIGTSMLIQVAANSNWRLGLKLTRAPANGVNQQLKKPLQFLVTVADSKQYQGAGSSGIFPADGPIIIAAGPATTGSETTLWLDIPVTIRINDYSQYPAGLYDFTVSFVGEILSSL
ncbi:MAG TPA: hypothetical protein VHY08_22685, partial [Bacillota bacterium]|nr:hypothetical protein [Bacillota bacterium]